MENLESVLENVTVEPIAEVPEVVTTTLEPTTEEITAIIEAIKAGKSDGEIKKEIRRFVYDNEGNQISAQGFSFDQIDEIRQAYFAKLSPNPIE